MWVLRKQGHQMKLQKLLDQFLIGSLPGDTFVEIPGRRLRQIMFWRVNWKEHPHRRFWILKFQTDWARQWVCLILQHPRRCLEIFLRIFALLRPRAYQSIYRFLVYTRSKQSPSKWLYPMSIYLVCLSAWLIKLIKQWRPFIYMYRAYSVVLPSSAKVSGLPSQQEPTNSACSLKE